MSQQSDKLIIEAAKAEHKRLEASVIRLARVWRSRNDALSARALADAVTVLTELEIRHKERLDAET